MKVASLGVLVAAALCGGCTTESIYASGQTWQRNECQKLADKAERDRCLAGNSASYDNYRRQAEADKKN